jgi:phosphoglycolate phosphatase
MPACRSGGDRERPLTRPRAVLFDWDNTLVDSWRVIHRALEATFVAMGVEPWSLEQTRGRVRLSLRDSFPALFGARWEEAAERYYENYRALHLAEIAPLPGAQELLDALARSRTYMGLVSNKNGIFLRQEVAQLGWQGYFGAVVGATDAPEDKPAPAPVHLALRDSGVEAGPEVWFVGDTEIDALCARNAGCVPVLVWDSAALAGQDRWDGGAVATFASCLELTRALSDL